MRAYLLYKDKSVKGFKRLMTGGGAVFDKYKAMAVSFIRYAGSDLDKKFAEYDTVIDLNSIHLEDIFPKKYKWLVSDMALKTLREYTKNLNDRSTEFQGGKEDSFKIVVGLTFLRFVLVTKIVETYLDTIVDMKENNLPIDNIDLADIGIGKQVLKYFDILQELDAKTVDDWINYKADSATAGYFYSSMKRILSILTD